MIRPAVLAAAMLLLAPLPGRGATADQPPPGADDAAPAAAELDVSSPIDDREYSPAIKACIRAAHLAEDFERCSQEELDRQTGRLNAALHARLVSAADDDQRSVIQGQQAAWIMASNNRCFVELRKEGPVNRTRGLNCLIKAAIRRRLAVNAGAPN